MSQTNPTVYVVDDAPSVRKALERLIGSMGLEVVSFPSAQDFLLHPCPEAPSCLVLDVRMPGMSGLDLQKQLAARDRFIPIIFITGHGEIPMAVEAMKDGATDFLQKPFHDQELLDAIHRALELDRTTRIERAQLESVQERLDTLSDREREVFALVVTGLLNKQVAGELGISEKTVKVHRARVMDKMAAESLADLVRMAERVGIPRPASEADPARDH